jgi:hypothetical protein
MLCSLLTLLTFLTVRNRMNDPDTWWHLRTGQTIWWTHRIPTTDLYSYTTHHHAWVPHEWLAQVTLFAAYRFAGYQGVLLWLVACSAVLILAGYGLCALYSGNSKTAFAGALVIWLFATSGLAPRPQVLGYLLLTVELIVLELARTRSVRWLWVLPGLFAVWVNVHASFALGLAVLAVTSACAHVEGQWGLIISERWDRERRQVLLTVFAVSAGALAISPGGWRQAFYPMDTLLHQHATQSYITEWAPLTVTSPRGSALVGLLGVSILFIFARRASVSLREVILVTLAAVFALQHTRMVFAFGILAAPLVARLLAPLWDVYEKSTDRPWLNAAMMLGVALILWHGFPSRAQLEAEVMEANPTKAVQYITSLHLAGPMMNAFDYGGYLIWAMPEQPVFIDGRADVFAWTGVFDEMARWSNLEEDPQALLDKYHVQFCVLERGTAIARVLPLLPCWRQVHADEKAVVIQRIGDASMGAGSERCSTARARTEDDSGGIGTPLG